MAEADIRLLIGVARGGADGDSEALIRSEIDAIMKNIKAEVQVDTKNFGVQLRKQLDSISKNGKFYVNISKINIGAGAIADFRKQLSAVVNSLNLDKGTSITISSEGIGDIKSKAADMEALGNAATNAAQKTAAFKVQIEALSKQKAAISKALSGLNNSSQTEEERAKIAELNSQYEQWAVKIETIRASKEAATDGYRAELDAEGASIQSNINKLEQERQAAADAAAAQKQEAANRKAAEDAAEKAAEKARAAEEKAYGSATERNNLYKQISDSIVRIKKAQQDWTAAETGKTSGEYANLSGYINRLQGLQSEFNKLSKDEIRQKLSAINKEFATSSGVIKNAGENTKTFSDRMGGLAKKFTSWLTVSQVIMQVYRALKQMVTAVIEVDTAMTELKKVTDETDATYTKFLENAASRSKKLGATLADTVNATADFARLGYNLDESSQLADAALIYKNVGDGIEDISESSESLISTMKAFGISAEDAMLIVDKFNITGNNFAISSKGVGDALMRSASALAAANNTLDESIALVTAANSTVQDADKVGTALKTVSMFLRAAKTEAEEAGESTDGMANSVSELRDELFALTGGKVDIQIDEDSFKSTYQIMKELSGVWSELTDISQANILELIGGKRNSNVVMSLLENFNVAEEVMENTANAAGSALEENEKYLNSIEGKISQFKATFQDLSTTLIDSEFVKNIVELGTGLLNILNAVAKVIDAVGGLNTVLGVTLGIVVAINSKSIASFLLNLIKPIKSIIEGFSAAKAAGLGFKQVITNAFAQATAGATTFQTALGAIGIALAVLSVGITIFKKFHKTTEELVESSNELKEAFQEVRSTTQSNIETLNGFSDEFKRLSAGVDKYGKNISLSADDYKRYKEIVEQVVEISPSLIRGYDEENGYLADKNGLLERAIELQEREYQNELRQMATPPKLSEALAGAVSEYSKLLNGDVPISDTTFSNSIWGVFNVNNRDDIPDGTENGEFLARQIMTALGVENIDEELQKYFNDYGYWQPDWFWDDYVDRIVADIQSGHSDILNSISWEDADFESKSVFDNAVEETKDAATEYSRVRDDLAQKNKDVSDQLMLVAESNEKYAELSDGAKDVITSFVNSFGMDDITKTNGLGVKVIDEDAVNRVKAQINGFMDKITPYIQNLLNVGSNLKLGLDKDGNTLSVKEYQDLVKNFIAGVNKIDDEELKLYIQTSFGIDENSVEFEDSDVTKAIEHAKNLLQDEYDYIVDDMSIDEVMQIYYNISAEPNSLTPEQLRVDLIKTTETFDTLSKSATGVVESIQNAQKILSSQANGKSISIADFSAEGMKDYNSALEYVNGTMQLNAEKVREISEAKAEEKIATIETNKAISQSKYIENARQIEAYRKQIRENTYAEDENQESIQASIDALLNENATIADTCKQYDLLSSSIREAIGTYQNWLNAQSASDYGDMADDAAEAMQRIFDTYNSESEVFGDFGSKKFGAAVDFIVPDSVDRDDLAAIEAYMANVREYLSFDDDGNIDGLNIDTFLSNAVKAGLMNYSDEDGWTIAGKQSMEDFAKGLGLSDGLVQAFFDELQLKGAKFDWGDEAVKTYGDLAIEATEAAEALRQIDGNENLVIKTDVSDLSTTEEQLSALDGTIAEMNGIKAKPDVDASEVEYANSIIQYCITQKQLLNQPDVMRVDTTQCDADIANTISLLQEFQNKQNTLEIQQSIGADTTEAETDVAALVERIQQLSPEVKATLGLDTTSAEALQASIDELSADTLVTFGVDASAITEYNPESKTCDVIYNPDTDLLPKSFGPYDSTVKYVADLSDLPTYFKTLTRYVNYTAIGDTEGGVHKLNGTAHASGTAQASGNWGTAPGGRTLVGELGREIVVDPHTGRWYTVGDNGAEFRNIPAGAIVFNHKQTEDLLANGYVSGRASALVSGTAMVTGGYKPYKPSGSTSGGGTNNGSGTKVVVTAEVDDSSLEEKLKDTLEKLKDELEEILGDFEHSIFLLEKNGGSTTEIIAIYRKMQEAVHAQAEKYRELGLSENSDYIQELQKQWWEYQDSIQEAIVADYEKATGERENAITLTENWLEKAIAERNVVDVEKNAGDIAAYYRQMQKIIHEQAEWYRSQGYSDTSDEVSKLSDLWWDYEKNIEEVKQRIVDNLVDMVNDVSDAVDEIQNVFDTLKSAAKEYAENGGFISVDAFQAIVGLGPEYMQYLRDENGLLAINEESINKVIAAKTEQLALESAMNYVERLRLALRGDSLEDLNQLLYATTEATNSTWGLVYANLALLGLNSDQYEAALHNINAIRSIADSAVAGIGVVGENLDDMRGGLDDILKYVMDMIKQKINDQIDALEQMKKDYADIISLRKEAMQAAKDEADYEDEVADKVKEIAKLQERITTLSLDNSRESQAQRIKLEEEMSNLQKELADSQAEHAFNAQETALDKMQESYEQEKDAEITALENTISSYQKLYDLAIDYIQTHWDTLYSELISWNTEYGSVLNSEITTAWENCLAAAQRYGSYVAALNAIGTGAGTGNNGNPNPDGGVVGGTTYDNSSTREEQLHAIIRKMYRNSISWATADDKTRAERDAENLRLGASLSQFGITAKRGSDGVWYIDNVGGEKLYEKYKKYCYHTGGIVGDAPTLKQNEVLALLEKGEAVLDSRKEEGLYRIVDFATILSEKLGKAISTSSLSGSLLAAQNALPKLVSDAPNGITKEPVNSVKFGDVYIYGANDETVEKHREINRQFTNEVLKQLNIKR